MPAEQKRLRPAVLGFICLLSFVLVKYVYFQKKQIGLSAADKTGRLIPVKDRLMHFSIFGVPSGCFDESGATLS